MNMYWLKKMYWLIRPSCSNRTAGNPRLLLHYYQADFPTYRNKKNINVFISTILIGLAIFYFSVLTLVRLRPTSQISKACSLTI